MTRNEKNFSNEAMDKWERNEQRSMVGDDGANMLLRVLH